MQILTKEDLEIFKLELFKELHNIFKDKKPIEKKEWIKSKEVREILNISPGTLQHLRVTNQIAFSRVGGLIFYKREDVVKLMESNRYERKERKPDLRGDDILRPFKHHSMD